jgi:hypothetical protein
MSYTGICLKRLRETMKNVGLDCWSLGIILTQNPRIKRKHATHYCYWISPAICPQGCFNQSYIGNFQAHATCPACLNDTQRSL